ERRVAANADQAAPGALAHQLADAGLAEVPGHGVAAGAGEFVDDHHLGAEDGAARRRVDLARARGPVIEQRSTQVVDDVIRSLTAAVETLVDHGSLLVYLGEEIAVEVAVAAERRVWQINVSHFAFR